MADSLRTQARLIEELRATNAAHVKRILELRAENERLRETIGVLNGMVETLKTGVAQLKIPGKPGSGKSSDGKGLGGQRSSGRRNKPRGPKRGRKDAKRVVVSVEDAAEGSVHKDYQDFHAQLLELEVHSVIFMREHVVKPD